MFKLLVVLFFCCAVFSVAQGQKAKCGANQELRCVTDCPPEKTCANRHIEYSCLQVVVPCHNKCVCKPGFARDARGTCIPLDRCPPKSPKASTN